jgi:hypothetical protein
VRDQIFTVQDLQDDDNSLNETTNIDVEETGRVLNIHQDASKEDGMNTDSKDKETEVEMTTDNQMIEKDVELINQIATEAVAERQELNFEVVNVDSVRFLHDRQSNQQIDVWRRRKLKKRTQRNGVSSKKLIVVHSRVIQRAVPAARKEICLRDQAVKTLQGECRKVGCTWSSTWEETTE